MKSRRITASVLALSMTLSLAAPAMASFDSITFTPPETRPGTIAVTPENLDDLLFKNNLDVSKQWVAVMTARDNVEIARGELIPSLSLNLVAIIQSPPQFLVNSVSCLLPFLFPSKWFDFASAKKNARAEISALETTQLNTYATAYNLLSQFAGDEAVLAVMREQYDRLQQYVSGLQTQFDLGLASRADLLRGDLELRRARQDISALALSLDKQRAELRKILALGIEQKFDIKFSEESASALESAAATQVLINELFNKAPEHRQLDLLREAALDHVSSTEWAFLAGCSGSQGAFGPNQPNSIFTQSTSVSLSIGYGFFPRISLAKDSVKGIEIRETELMLELARLLEETQKSLENAKQRADEAAHTVETAESMLAEQTRLVELGKASVKDIFESFSNISKAKIELITNRKAIEGHRITLKRLGLEGRFLKVLIKSRKQFEINLKARKGS